MLGKPRDLCNLRAFGCQVFSRVYKSMQDKFSHKSWEKIFIGHASDNPSWLVYTPKTRSIIKTGSDIFNEDRKHVRQVVINKDDINETKTKVKKRASKPRYMSPSFVNSGCEFDKDWSSVTSLRESPPICFSGIRHINPLLDSVERVDYVLNLYAKIKDAAIDNKDFNDRIVDDDAQADS